MIIGIGDFRGGETRRARVNPDEARRLKWCGGWDTSRGHLSPDTLPALRGTEGVPNGYAGGTPPAQIPFCFRGAAGSYVVYRDSYGRLHMVGDDGDWVPSGQKQPCDYDLETDLISCPDHGLHVGDRVRFLDVTGTPGFGTQQDWWVLSDDFSAGAFKISLTYGGDPLDIVETGSCFLRAYAGPVLDVIADGGPCRIDNLLVFPTAGETAALRVFEPACEGAGGNVPTIRVRPLGLRGPTDYRDTAAPTVTPHSPHPATQLFDLRAAETDNPDSHFEVAAGSVGVTHYPAADYEELRLSKDCVADQLCAKYDLGETGAAITHQVYLNLDLKLTYTGDDPNARMSITGQFINTDQTVLSSGFEFVLYSDQICTTVIRSYAIPRIGSDGRIYRFMFHLGDLSQDCTVIKDSPVITCTGHGYEDGDTVALGRTVGTGDGQLAAGTVYFVCSKADDTFQLEASVGDGAITPNDGDANTVARAVRGLGIRTAPGWIPPQEMDLGGGVTTSGVDRLWLHSGDFDPTGNWQCMGNFLLPAVTFADSPWAIPTEPSKGQPPGRNYVQEWILRIASLPRHTLGSTQTMHILSAINRLPVSPGGTGTSATLLECFPDSYETFSPARPQLRYAYCFGGRDQLSTERYRPMISNPSAVSATVFADPWLTEGVGISLPTGSLGLDAGDEYGDYLTHVLVYRSIFFGFMDPAEDGAVGVWSDWHYQGYLRVVDGAVSSDYGYYKDCQRRQVACELTDTTNMVTTGSVALPAPHGLQPGDALTFGTTAGGVGEGLTYYVVWCPDYNSFIVSPDPDGNPRECMMEADGDTVTCLSHGFSVDDPILFRETSSGVAAGEVYYVETVPTEHTFTIKDLNGDPVTWTEGADNVVCTVSSISAAGTNTWTSAPAEPTVAGYPVPGMMEANHDYPSSARYAIASDGRIYALCLTWTGDVEYGHWSRPKDMEISNWQDYGSFPTTTSDPPEEAEGEELTDYAPDCYEGKGLLARQQSKFVFTDNGFYELVGADPIQGWDFLRRDSVGCRDARTVADCRSELIWHDGTDFYSYGGGLCEPISKGLIDSSRIHWDQPFGAAFARDQYVFFCHHDDPDAGTPYCLMIFDLQTRSWRRRYSESYQLAGICAAEDGSTVYGVMCDDDHRGEVVDLFSDTTDYGGAQTYDVWTQYMVIAPPGEERHVSNALLEVVTDQTSIDLTIDVYSQGRVNDSKTGLSLTVYDHQSIYGAPELNCDLTGDAVAVRVRYTETHPPDIHFIGVNVDDPVAG